MRFLVAEPRSIAGVLLPCHSLWNDIGDPVFYGVGLAGLKNRANDFFLALLLAPFFARTVFSALLSFYGFVLLGWGLWTDRELIVLSQFCIANLF